MNSKRQEKGKTQTENQNKDPGKAGLPWGDNMLFLFYCVTEVDEKNINGSAEKIRWNKLLRQREHGQWHNVLLRPCCHSSLVGRDKWLPC